MPHRVSCLDCALPGLRIVDIRSDRQFPRHAHDQFGIGVMLDGGHRSWSGRGPVEAGPDHVITVSPNEMHDGLPLRGATRHWRMLFVDPGVVADLAGAERATREFERPVIADAGLARRLAGILRDLPDGTQDGAECVSDVLGALLDRPGTAPSGARGSGAVRLMLERIHDAPEDAPGLAQLAALAGLTPFTAIRRFRRETGTTPYAYLIQYRVRRAQRAIGAGASLTEAALVAGFADQSHMTRAFVRQFGVAPGQWRSRAISFKTEARALP